MEKFKQGTAGWYIACIRDPVLRKELQESKDYQSHKYDDVNDLHGAIIYSTQRDEDSRKYANQALDGKIPLAEHPIYDNIGELPEQYWVENTGKEFVRLYRKLTNSQIEGSHKYYLIQKRRDARCSHNYPKDSIPMVDYSTWKAYVLSVIGEQVKEEIVPEPDMIAANLLGKDYAIHCNTAEEYKAVVRCMDKAGKLKMTNDHAGWDTYGDKVCVGMASYPEYGTSYNGVPRIEASEFLKANAVPVGEKVVYKLNDWVTVLDTAHIRKYDIKAIGKTFQLTFQYEVDRLNSGTETALQPYHTNTNYYTTDLRPATQAEISAVTEVPVTTAKTTEYKVGDYVVPIVDVDVPEYGLGACSGIKKGVAYPVKQVNVNDLVIDTDHWYIYKKDVRMAKQSEIDALSTPTETTGKQQEIVVGTWMYILMDRNWAKVGDLGQVNGRKGNWYLTGIKANPAGMWYFSEGTAECRIATEAEIQAHLAKDKVIVPKVEKDETGWEVGDWVTWLTDQGGVGKGTYQLSHYGSKTDWKVYYEGGESSYHTDINELVRPATANERAYAPASHKKPVQKVKPTPTNWSAVTTDGVTVYEDSHIWWVNTSSWEHVIDGKAGGQKDNIAEKVAGKSFGSHEFFSSKEVADRYIAEKSGKKVEPVEVWGDSWKIGDVLPEEWLNKQIVYTNRTKREPGGFHGDRRIEKLATDGYGLISGSCNTWYIGPKSNYPTYSTKVTNNNQSQSINQKSKTTETSYEKHSISNKEDSYISSNINEEICTKSRSSVKVIDIPANTESVIISKRRNSTAICDLGQPEYIV